MTKIEAIALDNRGVELARESVPTPRHDYQRTLETIVGLVRSLEAELAYGFSDGCDTPLRQARHGDSSGVRGAAWLWN